MTIRKIEGSYIETSIDDELVLIQIDRGSFHALKGTGLAIWEMIDGTRHRDAIVDVLTSRFDVPRERCEADVDRFLGQVVQAGFVAGT